MKFFSRLASLALTSALLAGPAFAQASAPVPGETLGAPKPWELGMQPASSPVKAEIIALHWEVMIIITGITLLVGALLAVVCYKFNAKRHPVPSKTSHNTVLEVAWTALPVVLLLLIWFPSLRVVYFEDRTRDADMTIKVTGHQWYWEYNYPAATADAKDIDYSSYPIQDEDIKPGQLRRLDVDNQLVLPVGKNVKILLTGGDVIHSFFIPSLGVQRYAMPGRVIETWVRIDRPGTFYGQCNQICGENHSYMPIAIHAVSDADYQAWLTTAKTKYAANPSAAGQVAAAN